MATRKINFKKKKRQVIDKYIEKLSKLTENELVNLSKKLIINISNGVPNKNDSLEYEALLKIIELNNINNTFLEGKYKYYPHYEDNNFNEKIYKKLEFYLNKTYKTKKLNISEKNKLSKQLCDPLYETTVTNKEKKILYLI